MTGQLTDIFGIYSAEPTSSAQTSPRVGFHVLAMAKTTGIQVCSQKLLDSTLKLRSSLP